MIRKTTLTSVAILALIFIPAQAEDRKCQAGKCGTTMMEKSKANVKEGKGFHKKMKKRGHASPLLMYLPSPMRLIMKLDKDPKLALTPEQRTTFEAQRKEMMPKMMKLKKEIKALTTEIYKSCKKLETAEQQKERVEKLAKLKTEATMLKLTCINKVKTTLSKEQQEYMKAFRKARKEKMKEKMKGIKKDKKC